MILLELGLLGLYTRTSCLGLGKAADRSNRTCYSFSNQVEEVAAGPALPAETRESTYDQNSDRTRHPNGKNSTLAANHSQVASVDR